MPDHILTLNAGSSSFKFALFRASDLSAAATGQIEGLGTSPHVSVHDANGRPVPDTLFGPVEGITDHDTALQRVLRWVGTAFPEIRIVAVGHRIVHGGTHHDRPVILTDAVLADLHRLDRLAPLHQPHNLACVRAAMTAFPGVPQIGCFDTGFHRGQPFVNDVFAIPRALYDEGVRRYGFHGISYEYVSGRLAEMAPHHAAGRVVIAHLGSGASMCALRAGQSVASTMGFSALDGLPMGTRPGQIDPGVLLYLLQDKGLTADQVSDLLYRQSGLKGLSGLSNDMRTLQASSDPKARQAIDYFVFRCRREFGAMAAALNGLDAIVFTGGIGENAATIRAHILEPMEWIGVELDPDRNAAHADIISSDRSRVRVFVIPTNEERMIARHAKTLLTA